MPLRRSFPLLYPPLLAFFYIIDQEHCDSDRIAIALRDTSDLGAREGKRPACLTKRHKNGADAGAPVFDSSFPIKQIYLSFILFRRRCSASWCLEAYVVDMRESPERVRPPVTAAAAPAPPAVKGAAGADAAGCCCECGCGKSPQGVGVAAASAACCSAIPLVVPCGAESWASCAKRAISSGAGAAF